MLLTRVTFLSNLFCDSSLLSSFELVFGYPPALLGVDSIVVPHSPLEAYNDQQCVRALRRLLKSRHSKCLPPQALPPGAPVYYYYKSSKHCESIEWRPGIVISAKQFFVQISNEKGRSSNMAYEDIKLKPKLPSTEELADGYVEEYISQMNAEIPHFFMC